MNLNGKITNPGEMRTQITLQSVQLTKSAGGAQVRSYTDLTPAVVYSRWINAHGTEAIQAQALQVQGLATVLIRYRADVNTRCVILKGSERYEILSIDNIQERNEYLELKVQLTKGGV